MARYICFCIAEARQDTQTRYQAWVLNTRSLDLFFRWRSGGSLLGSRSPLSAAHRYGVFLCSSLGSTPLRDTGTLCYRIKISMAWFEGSSALARCNCLWFFFLLLEQIL